MIKKWSYVAAAMLTAASGLALTSCIDNDEPYGIEQIRLATANLLEAKKSAVNAAQAAKEAEIEIARINAEVKKMKAENQRILNEAEAKIKEAEAQAKIIYAQAQAAIDQAEANRLQAEANRLQAVADDQKAQTEIYLARQKAQLDELIAEIEISVKKSQLTYDKALYDFEKEKLYNADQYKSSLYNAWEKAFEAYLTQLDWVNLLTKSYLEASKDFAEAAVDLVYNEKTGKWESKQYDRLKKLQENVAKAQQAIDTNNETIAKYQEVIADLEGVTTTDLYQLFEKYQAEAEANKAAWAAAQAEYYAIYADNKELTDEILNLKAQKKEFDDQQIEIPAYTWDPAEIDEAAFASMGITQKVIVEERTSYSLSKKANYNTAVKNYNDQIALLKNYLLDANDQLWTQARINELKNLLNQQNKNFEKLKENWVNAKTAYNMGNTPDFSVIPGEDAVVAAVADYNATATTFNTLWETYLDAKTQYTEAESKYLALTSDLGSAGSTIKRAVEAYDLALGSNQTTRDDAVKSAQQIYDSKVAQAESDYRDAKRKETKKLNELNKALAENNGVETAPDVVIAQANYKQAQDDAKDAFDAIATTKKDQQAILDQAIKDADNDLALDNQKAADTYEAAKTKFNNAVGSAASKEWLAAQDDYSKKMQAQGEAQEALIKKADVTAKYKALKDACDEQDTEVGGGLYLKFITDIQTALNSFNEITATKAPEFPEAMAPSHYQKEGVYVNVLQYLINMSQKAYGNLGFYGVASDGTITGYDYQAGKWDNDQAFLLETVNKEVIDEYIKELFPNLSEFNYPMYYGLLFGKYGQTLETETQINVANAMLDNQDLLSESIAPLEAGLKALTESMDAALEQKKEIENALEDKEAEFTEISKGVSKKLGLLNYWKTVYSNLLAKITNLIAQTDENVWKDKNNADNQNIDVWIKNTIQWYNDEIEKLKKQNAGEYKDYKDRADYQLKLYLDNEGVFTENPEAINKEFAELQLDRAKQKLANLEYRANELEAQYKAAANK